jgi:nucleotide-binding universal stress UspA family protein
VTVDTQVVSATGAGAAIAAEAERVGARLIAMTTHGERGLRRLVLGSVADKVVRSSHIPTLVFRPPPVVL